jgi:large subunit ribosomal protein L5
MWDFIERLTSAAIPRVRDFQGIDKKNFDNQGNLNYAIREQIVFPEISHDDIQEIFGLQINLKNTAKNKEEGIRLLKLLGFPIKD